MNTLYSLTPQEEAIAAEKGFSDKKKTWKFKAQNVRDFGFSTSRKFILDAMAVDLPTNKPLAPLMCRCLPQSAQEISFSSLARYL